MRRLFKSSISTRPSPAVRRQERGMSPDGRDNASPLPKAGTRIRRHVAGHRQALWLGHDGARGDRSRHRPGRVLSLLGPSAAARPPCCALSRPQRASAASAASRSPPIVATSHRPDVVFRPDADAVEHRRRHVLLPFRLAGRVGSGERDRVNAEIGSVGLAGFERLIRPAVGRHAHAVSIARALVTDPDLLLLDEPSPPRRVTRMRSTTIAATLDSRRPTVDCHSQRVRIGLPVDTDRGDDAPARPHRRHRRSNCPARDRTLRTHRAMPRSAQRCRTILQRR